MHEKISTEADFFFTNQAFSFCLKKIGALVGFSENCNPRVYISPVTFQLILTYFCFMSFFVVFFSSFFLECGLRH